MSLTFGQLKDEIRRILFCDGEAENLVDSHNLDFQTALYDLQKSVECFRVANTNVFPSCASYFQCGMTVLPAPRGEIMRVYVIGQDANGQPDYCSCVDYHQVAFSHIEQYVHLHRNCSKPNSLFSSLISFSLFGCGWRTKHRYPCPTDEGLESLPSLPQGFHYPQASTDLKGRSPIGVWALYRGRIYIAPWIESTETVVVEWNGIKNKWSDDDFVEDDEKFKQAVRLRVGVYHYSFHEENTNKLLILQEEWKDALKDLINDCRNQTRVREESEAGGGGSAARGLGSSDASSAAFYNEAQSFTASCPVGQAGVPVTVNIPAGQIGSSLSVADANAKAMAQAQSDANSRLSCVAAPIVYFNTVQTFTASCAGANGDTPAAAGVPVTITTPAGQFSSTVSQAAADAAALAAATALANSQLVCTFYNAPTSFTANCPTDTTGSDVAVAIQAAVYNSTVSQADADQKAKAAAQEQANAGLTCVGLPTYIIGNTEQRFNQPLELFCVNGNLPQAPAHNGTIIVTGICAANTFTTLATAATEAAKRFTLNQQAQAQAFSNAQALAANTFRQFQFSCGLTVGGNG